MSDPNKDWEKEYCDKFTKKIPFPYFKFEKCIQNPNNSTIFYTITHASIQKSANFELFAQTKVKEELDEIIKELKSKKAANKKKEDSKIVDKSKTKEGEEEKKEEENKEEEVQYDMYGQVLEKPPEPIDDIVEEAMRIFEHRKIKRDKEKKEKLKKTTEESKVTKTKKANGRVGSELKTQEPKMSKHNSARKVEEDKEEVAEGDKTLDVGGHKKEDKISDVSSEKSDEGIDRKDKVSETIDMFYKINTEGLYDDVISKEDDTGKSYLLSNLVNCQKILSKWEITHKGYRRVKNVYMFERMNPYMNFSGDGRFISMLANDNKTVHILDADTLETVWKKKMEMKDQYGNDAYIYDAPMLSHNGTYLVAGDYSNKYIFKREDDSFECKTAPSRNMSPVYMYGDTKFCGIKPSEDYTKSSIVVVDFLSDTEETLYSFDSYISSIRLVRNSEPYSDRKDYKYYVACLYNAYPKEIYVNFSNKDKKVEIFKDYVNVYSFAHKGNKIAVVYTINYTNIYVAVFEDGELQWKQPLKKTYIDTYSFAFTDIDGVEGLILVENVGYESIKVYHFDVNNVSDYAIKPIRNMVFQYPYLAYIRGTREYWVQDLNNNIKVYYFENDIVATENYANTRKSANKLELGVIVDCGSHLKAGNLVLSGNINYEVKNLYNKSTTPGEVRMPYISLYNRRVQVKDLPNMKLKAFYKIKINNRDTKTVQPGLLLHMKDTMIALSLISKDFMVENKEKFTRGNVIPALSKSAFYFWKYGGTKIEKMNIPFDPHEKKWTSKFYEASDDMKLLRTTTIDDKEYLC